MNPPGIRIKGILLDYQWLIGLLAWSGMAAAVHAITCTVTSAPTIDPIGGDSITYQSPNWATSFKNYCGEDFQMVASPTLQAAAGVTILNFETANGFPAATSALTPTGTIFDSSNTISPYTIAGAVTKITTGTGVSIDVQYRAFDNAHNILSTQDTTQGNFIVLDRSVNDTMISGAQGLVAGSVYYQSFGPGGTYLNFDRNLQKFGVALNANSLSSTDVICLFDAEGILLAKYTVGVAAGQALYFGVNSAHGIIRSVWIGQSTSTNGLVIDDVAFVPAPAPAVVNNFSFAGSSGTNGWYRNNATVTTSTDHVTIQSTSGDAKIYRGITLASGTWTMSGVGSGNILVQLQTSWTNSAFATLNLSQSSGWCSDHMTFVTPGTGSASYYLSVMVMPNPGTANIQTLSINTASPTPYAPVAADLQTQKNLLTKVRGMNSSWSASGTLGLTHFTEMRNWKANVVRLQMHPVFSATSAHQDFWTAWPAYRATMVQNIRDAQTAGLKTIIDLHEPPFTDAPPANTTYWSRPDLNMRYGMLWKDIAQTIVNNNLTSAVWAYEIINEPYDSRQMPSPPRQWWPLAANVINTIRTVDANTWIVYDVGPGSLVDGFNNLLPLPDPSKRIIYSGHFYYPSNFCLQGIAPDLNHSTPYNAVTANLAGILAPVDAFETKWKAPIYIGEFSTTRWGPVPDTKNWMQDAVNLFEARNWNWTYFAWKEYTGWRLDLDSTFWTGTATQLDDAHKSDRGTVIYNALQANP